MNAPPPPKNNPDISTERRLAGVIDNRPECLQKKTQKKKRKNPRHEICEMKQETSKETDKNQKESQP
jgi:hypothetical protein